MKQNCVPDYCDLDFSEPIALWDEAIPLGSGLTGCLIYGDGAPLKVSLDRGDLWDCRPAPEVLAEDYTYEELIRLVKEEKQEEILRRFDSFYNQALPTKLPAGKLQLFFDKPQGVQSRLSLQRAEAHVTLTLQDGTSELFCFLSAEDHIGHLKAIGIPPRAEFLPHDFTSSEQEEAYSLTASSTKRLGYAPSVPFASGRVRGIRQETRDGAFALLYGEKKTPFGAEAVFTVACSRDGADWLERSVSALEQALDQGYDEGILPHLAWWEAFWQKSALSLPDKVLEKNWYLTQYYFGSCSRKGCPPMPLQGVWTADNGKLPPWKGDYHGDLNLQFSYYAGLKADHLEECEAFFDFFTDRNQRAGREFARTFFDAPGGSCVPSVFAFDGTSLGGWPMYSTNITNQIWELHLYYQYYKYTCDEEFLRQSFLPQLIECEVVVRRWLVEDDRGRLTLPLSSSPEINDNNLSAWLPSLSTYDLALLRFLYLALIEFTDGAEYKEILRRLPDYPVDETGYQIYEGYPLRESHRHLSHMMQVFPLNLVDLSDPSVRKVLENSVENIRKQGPAWWVGFSFAWIADLEARLGDGEHAALHLRQLTDNLYSVNGFHLNGDYRRSGLTNYSYRPFTLESNMMMAEALQEMLMQCYDGIIRLFPAVPDSWLADCSFEGFLAFGNVKVSAAAKDGKVVFVQLIPRKDGRVRLLNPATRTIEILDLKQGETYALSF